MKSNYVTLQNSARVHPRGARVLLKSLSSERIEVTVVLRGASSAESREKSIEDLALQLPKQRKHLSVQEFTRLHGARNEDLTLIKHFAKEFDLRIMEASKARRCVVLSATVSNFNRAFQVKVMTYSHNGHEYRSHQDPIQIPSHLHGIVEAVFGLENRALMEHHTFLHGHHAKQHTVPNEVAEAYNFPTAANGKGQCIAIIELGGGFYRKDIKEYFRQLGLAQPKINVIELNGQQNNPAPPKLIKKLLDFMGLSTDAKSDDAPLSPKEIAHALWTVESTMDIQLIGSFANGAQIVVYFAPNNAQGKYHALTAALTNTKYQPNLISCSWGATEDGLPDDVLHTLNHVFQDAALRGVTICFSSGDRGEDPGKTGKPRVHFPASSPYVLSCGGTHWTTKSRNINEVVWSESLPKYVAQSGGGVSKVFDQPYWQSTARIKLKTGRRGRGVPDIAGKADMMTGYRMLVGGYTVTMGGTSAAAPMWAGLIARLNQMLGCPLGYVTPFLYQRSSRSAFHDITKGSNGKNFHAGPGWDPCTGWGTPNGKKLLSKLNGD